MSIKGRTSLSQWLLAGLPFAAALGIVAVVVLHTSLKITWKAATVSVAVQLGIQVTLYFVMFWIRERFQRNHDFRPTIAAFGLYVVIAGLVGMKYAEQLGVTTGVFRENCIPFAVFIAIVTLICLTLFTFWRLE